MSSYNGVAVQETRAHDATLGYWVLLKREMDFLCGVLSHKDKFTLMGFQRGRSQVGSLQY
jgi:hypothetical protein